MKEIKYRVLGFIMLIPLISLIIYIGSEISLEGYIIIGQILGTIILSILILFLSFAGYVLLFMKSE